MARSHYLAQCYLKGFATRDDQSAAVWQYRKSTSELRKRGVRNVAHRPDYYSREFGGEVDDSVEMFFSKIESRWPSIRQVLNRFVYSANVKGKGDVTLPKIYEKELIWLLHFMFINTLRRPSSVEPVRTHMADTLPDVVPSRLKNMVLESMEGFHDRWISAFLENNIKKTLCVYVSPAGSRRNFVTTDNPVVYYGGEDGFDKSAKLLFPSSRSVLIGFAPMNDSDPVRMKILHDAEHMDQANMVIIGNAADEIYASEPCYLERLLKGKGYSVNRRVATR